MSKELSFDQNQIFQLSSEQRRTQIQLEGYSWYGIFQFEQETEQKEINYRFDEASVLSEIKYQAFDKRQINIDSLNSKVRIQTKAPSLNAEAKINVQFCQCQSSQIKSIKKEKKISKGENSKKHPTKNILVNFKKFFLSYLQKAYGNKIQNYKEFLSMKKKSGMNMKDYQILFNIEQFRPTIDKIFKKKQMYRYLMTSKVKGNLKKIYLSKIPAFQIAFKSRKFQRINF